MATLRSYGQNITVVNEGLSVVQVTMKKNKTLTAHSDTRKFGLAATYWSLMVVRRHESIVKKSLVSFRLRMLIYPGVETVFIHGCFCWPSLARSSDSKQPPSCLSSIRTRISRWLYLVCTVYDQFLQRSYLRVWCQCCSVHYLPRSSRISYSCTIITYICLLY